MASNNMHNLTTLIKRLEAATSRLEDMATSSSDDPTANTASTAAPSLGGVAATQQPSPPAPPALPAPKAEELPSSVEGFDSFISAHVVPFVKLSEGLGGGIAQQAPKVLEAFKAQRKFLLIQTKSKKPQMSDPVYMELLQPTQEGIMAVGDIKDKNRGKPDFNQLSTVAEGISVLAWVTVENKPYKSVDEALGSAQFWGNRVLKEFKEKDPKQVEWVNSYYKIFKELSQFVQDTFPNGLLWNSKGLEPSEAMKAVDSADGPAAPSAPSAPAGAAGGPPPPPPPPPGPPPMFDVTSPSPAPSGGASAGAGLGAVFSELNKGSDVTKGLKKVSADQMTHKNPSLRASSTVPERSTSSGSIDRARSPVPGKKPKPESMRTKKPAKKELDGNKWYIENFENESSPITIDAEITHSVLISRCNKTTIIVRGKANAISVDNCNRLALVVESLVSSVDVIKAQNLEMQVTGVLPTILMDQVDGASVYLSKESENTEVYSSKCSSINLNLLDPKDPEGDYKENALPEQMRTYIKEGKLVTEIVEHAG